jgi:polyisoprenoid-binding protein YceI
MQTAVRRGLAPLVFKIDPAVSRFTVQAFATGLLSTFGHNPTFAIREYTSEIHFVPETFEKAYVRVAVQTNHMDLLDDIKRDDRKKLEKLMYGEVLDVERFPAAVFESKMIAVDKLDHDLLLVHAVGDLTLHGLTQAFSFDARVAVVGSIFRISGEFSFRQSDFGIQPISFAAGALRLKDELKFRMELVARLQD